MHDLTFCNEILRILEDTQKTLPRNARIVAANVSLSAISHVKPETLKETFKAMTSKTPFSRIKLKITPLELGIKCNDCKKGFLLKEPVATCPECRSSALNIIYNKEFLVESVDIDKKVKPAKPAKKRKK